MASDATDSPAGMASAKATCPTSSTAPKVQATPTKIVCGAAATATASNIPARSLPLSADEAKNLARIAKDRRNGFMVSAPDVDFLLDLIGRM